MWNRRPNFFFNRAENSIERVTARDVIWYQNLACRYAMSNIVIGVSFDVKNIK